MSFLAPYMLWGALAASIPVALHFFYRSRYRTVPWAAMKFLLAAIEQTSRRLRFQELLLLLLRVAMLVLLALAFARPTSSVSGRGGQGDAVDAVFILDTSMSMGAKAGVAPPGGSADTYLSALRQFASADGTVTCFDRARAAALAVLAGLPPQSTVQVVACADRATLLGPRTPSHLDQAKQLIEGLTLTQLGTDYLPAVTAAGGLLRQGPSPNKELYLFSDMQQAGWSARSSALVERLKGVKEDEGASIQLVHCSPRNPTNVSVVGITPQSSLRGGERADFAVLVRNTGKNAARNLTVTLEIGRHLNSDGEKGVSDSQGIPTLEPGATRAVVLSAVLDKAGKHVLSASARTDDLDGDNRLDQVIQVPDQVGVLLVDGAPNLSEPSRAGSYHLAHALNPLPVTVVTPERASPRDLAGKDVCILVNARLEDTRNEKENVPDPARGPGREQGAALSAEFVRGLASFVQEGRPLLVFAGDRVEPDLYNRVLFEQHRLLPYRILRTQVLGRKKEKPWTLDRTTIDGAPFLRFKNEPGYATIDNVEVTGTLILDPNVRDADLTEESRVLLRYKNGLPAIASRRRPGQGEVMLFTTSVSDPPGWSTWQLSPPAFVPFVQVAVNHLLEGQPQQLNRVAGEPAVWQVGKQEAEQAFDLVNPDRTVTRIGYPVTVKGKPTLAIPDLARAGIYRVLPAGREVEPDTPVIAVTPDVRETDDLETLTPAQIDERLGFTAAHVVAGEDGSVFSGAERLRREWTLWLLAGVLVLVGCEMLLAWFCGRSPVGGSEKQLTW